MLEITVWQGLGILALGSGALALLIGFLLNSGSARRNDAPFRNRQVIRSYYMAGAVLVLAGVLGIAGG